MASTNENRTVDIEATLYWPNLTRPNDMTGKYQVDLGNLDRSAIQTLSGIGVSPKVDEPDEGKPAKETFVTAKSNYPIKVMFKKGVEVSPVEQIGNGTKAKVRVTSYDWKFKNKTGVGLGIKKLMVTELNKYSEPEEPDFEDAAEPSGFDADALDEMFED